MTTSAPFIPPAPPGAIPEKPRGRTRVRLSTFLLLIAVAALLIGLYAQRRREAQLMAFLSLYRNTKQEGIYDALDQPIALSYADGDHLAGVLKEIKKQTTKNPKLPKLPTGIPIYVDPIGLQEAERSMNSVVERPSSADRLALGEHLKRILEPLGLAYVVKEGFLMITSKDSVDEPFGDDTGDPYLKHRDVLK
ncbi:MAG: hypothetical protein ACLQGP_19025 [Isosphaeraceae bacterium]